MLRDDHFLRLQNQALKGLQDAIELRKAKQHLEALDTIKRTLEGYFGLNIILLNQMDETSLLDSMRYDDELNTQQAILAADLFHEAGILYTTLNQPYEAHIYTTRALAFYLEVLLQNGEDLPQDLPGKINQLIDIVEAEQLSLDTRLSLFYYLDQQGNYSKAQQLLEALMADEQIGDEMTEEGIAFYKRLLDLSDAELERVGMVRGDVEKRLEELAPDMSE